MANTYPRRKIGKRAARWIRQRRIEDTMALDTDIARIKSRLTWHGLDNDDLADLDQESYRQADCAMDRFKFWQRQLAQMGGEL